MYLKAFYLFYIYYVGDGGDKGDRPPKKMLEGIKRFLKERSSQHVTNVNIVILHAQQDIFDIFRDVIIGKSDINEKIPVCDSKIQGKPANVESIK